MCIFLWLPRCFYCLAPMSVKEVVQSLVDDNLVNCEKVGSSSYYWAFKSQVLNIKENKLADIQKQLTEIDKKQKATDEKVIKARSVRTESVSDFFILIIFCCLYIFIHFVSNLILLTKVLLISFC